MEIGTVLCPVDFTAETGRELALARQICERYGSRLVVEHNLDPRPPNFLTVTWMWSEEFENREEEKLNEAQLRLRSLLQELSESVKCEAKLTRGPIDESLLFLVRELPAHLLIMGSHGWSTAEHRSVTEKMISKCPAPVLTVGNAPADSEAAGFQLSNLRILVTSEGRKRSQPALDLAVALCEDVGSELVLLEVYPRDIGSGGAAERIDSEAGERLRQLLPARLQPKAAYRAVAGRDVESVLEIAKEEEANLIIRQVHRRGLGWGAASRHGDLELLHRSLCPVLFVPAKYSLRPTGDNRAVV
jgi:nucleotide-binding universal stress UspA family protein